MDISKSKNFEYTRIGSGIEIKKYIGSATSVNIPSKIDDLPVIYIGEKAFELCKSLTSIQIPNSVTYIGNGAFHFCESLTSIQIPNSVTSIGNSAFHGCHSLTSIQIPNSVTSIGNSTFHFCSSLKSVRLLNPNTIIGKDAFNNCNRALRILRVPIAEPVVETSKIKVDSYVNYEEKKAEESESSNSDAAKGCLATLVFLFVIYLIIKSIWNFIFG